mmetsp:Transcript_6091/g.7687  ORF Transcript_6091/g.7687 Transcript_6091/m.7687 type:complete len:353 (+) Transcript_6091:180-1238(+)
MTDVEPQPEDLEQLEEPLQVNDEDEDGDGDGDGQGEYVEVDGENSKAKKKKEQPQKWKKVLKFIGKRAAREMGVDIAAEMGNSLLQEIRDEFENDNSLETLELLQKEMLPDMIGHQAFVIQGITYMLLHSDISKMVAFRIKVSTFLTVLTILGLIIFAYPYQALWLIDATAINFYLCWLIAFAGICFEGFFIVVLFIVPLVYGNIQLQLFRRVYLENASDAAKIRVENTPNRQCFLVDKAGLLRLMFFLSTVWLNVIPFLGQYAYLKLNEKFYLWELFSEYFELHGVFSIRKQFEIVQAQHIEGDFGASAIFLKSLPVVGPVFALSNAVGAALYIAEVEPCIDMDDKTKDIV